MAIRPALDQLLDTLTGVEVPLATWLADGVNPEEIDAKLGGLSIRLASEVSEYFAWRNGLRLDRDTEQELFPGGVMLSLDEAVAEYRQLIEVATQIARQTGMPSSSLWDERWFPLFRNAGGGDYHVTIGGGEPGATAPIVAVVQQDPGAAWLAFDSLTDLIRTVTQCFKSGAYTTTDGIVHEDRLRAAEILRAYNPVRTLEAGWPRPTT